MERVLELVKDYKLLLNKINKHTDIIQYRYWKDGMERSVLAGLEYWIEQFQVRKIKIGTKLIDDITNCFERIEKIFDGENSREYYLYKSELISKLVDKLVDILEYWKSELKKYIKTRRLDKDKAKEMLCHLETERKKIHEQSNMKSKKHKH